MIRVALLGLLLGVCCGVSVEGGDLCANDYDDDGDGRVDCDDESCAFSDVCGDCGNGAVDGAEGCDDGNHEDGDGCDARCAREDCDEGEAGCGPAVVVVGPCGDSVLQPGEECEDGNRAAGDGCDAGCRAEFSECTGETPGVQCIDGNINSGDGCSATCRSEFCGDGIVQPTIGERCDDAAPGAAAVGCFGCRIPVCGNGIFEGNERCEDGNRRDGDGCSSRCQPE